MADDKGRIIYAFGESAPALSEPDEPLFAKLIGKINAYTEDFGCNFRAYIKSYLSDLNYRHHQDIQAGRTDGKKPLLVVFLPIDVAIPASQWVEAVDSHRNFLRENHPYLHEVSMGFAQRNFKNSDDPDKNSRHFILDSFGKAMVTRLESYKAITQGILKYFPQTQFHAELYAFEEEGIGFISPCIAWRHKDGLDMKQHIERFLSPSSQSRLGVVSKNRPD